MDTRRFFILETLLSKGDSTEKAIMKRLWELDADYREEREEPWKWYYNTTKCFAQMERKGQIGLVGQTKDGLKIWSIDEVGGQDFLKEIEKKAIFNDPLYARRKKAVTALALRAVNG